MKIEKLQGIIFPIALVIACVLFNLVISNHYFHTKYSPDEMVYNNIALALLDGKSDFDWGNRTQIDIGQEVTPFYSAIVAFTYFIAPSPWSPVIFNIILSCAAIILLFYTISNVTNNKLLSFLLSFGFIFYFPLWAYNYYIMMEITTVFFLSLLLFLLTRYFTTRQNKFLFLTTLAFSIFILINNRFIVLFGVYVIFMALYLVVKNRLDLKSFLLSLLLAIAVVSPWFIRQYKQYDQFVFFTPLWNNVVANKIGLFKPVDFISLEEPHKVTGPLTYEQFVSQSNSNSPSGANLAPLTRAEFKKLIRENESRNIYLARIKRYFNLYSSKYIFYGPESIRLLPPSSKPYILIQLVLLLPIFFFSGIGIIIAILKKHWLMIMLSMFFISHLFLHMLIHYIDRYRLTILPVLLVLAAYGITEGIKLIAGYKKIRILTKT